MLDLELAILVIGRNEAMTFVNFLEHAENVFCVSKVALRATLRRVASPPLNASRLDACDDPDIFVLRLPPDANVTVNALQRAAAIVLQKPIRAGFGLTVTEAMWKTKPVIGGDTGGIRLQVVDHHTGYLVNSPEGAALRIRYLLRHRGKREQMGLTAREFVRENVLLTRHLREYLTLIAGPLYQREGRIEHG